MNITIISIIATGLTSVLVAVINSRVMHYKSEAQAELERAIVREKLEKVEARLDGLADTDNCCANLKTDVDEIKENIVELNTTINQFKTKSDDFDEKLSNAFMAIASDRISQGHRYFMSRGEITESSKMSMQRIFESYAAFGGNGYVGDEWEDLRNLPVV